MDFQYAASTRKGNGKTHNEDRIMVDRNYLSDGWIGGFRDEEMLAIMCDGVSGNRHGEKAAEIASLYFLNHDWNEVKDIPRVVNNINYRIHKTQIRESEYHKTATTLAGIYLQDHKLLTFNMGDTRIYVMRNNALEQVSRDHTLKQYISENNSTSVHCGCDHVLTQYLGGSICEAGVTIKESLIDEDQKILIVSDGIYRYVKQEDMHEIMNNQALLTEKCNDLIDTAIKKGSHDDMSACIIETRR